MTKALAFKLQELPPGAVSASDRDGLIIFNLSASVFLLKIVKW
jgi:hypothetical protein